MGEPAPPAQPTPPPAVPPLPGDVGQQPTTPPPPEPEPDLAADVARLRNSLESERTERARIERELQALRQQGMSDQERAVEQARAEGRAQANREAGLRVAAAEFRAAAAGRLADVDAALEVLDLSAFVDDDGNVNRRRLTALVEKLATATVPAGTPARVPAGPMGDGVQEDFLRAALGR